MSTQILLVEDDDDVRDRLVRSLEENSDLRVVAVSTVIDCLKELRKPRYKPDAVVIDVHVKAGQGGDAALSEFSQQAPKGYNLARKIHQDRSDLRIFAMTGLMDDVTPECNEWFRTVGDNATRIGVYHKQREWMLLRHRIFKLTKHTPTVKVFIVHGHDHNTKNELREYAEGLGWEIQILGEGLAQNQAWIERFEKHADQASLAWILFTPDEWGCPFDIHLEPERRPRPNVLLECGYFLGAFGRLSNRVLLFKKGNVQLPSDLDGVHWVKLNESVADADEAIRRELGPWL